MALWQYKFYVLPKHSVSEINPNLKFVTEDDLFDDSPYWHYEKVKPFIFNSISQILPLGKTWSENLIVYGDTESTSFDIFTEGGFIESVSFRIDFRHNYESILDKLILILMKNDMLVLDEDLSSVRLTEYDFKMKIESSEQYSKYHKLAKAINKNRGEKPD